MTEFLLSATDIEVSFGGRQILEGLSLGVHRGEFGALLGPSGSGKSTFLRTLAGIIRPDRGRVCLDGVDLDESSDRRLAEMIGFVPQDDIIHVGLRLDRALTHAARLRLPAESEESEIRAAVDRVLNAVALDHRRDVKIKKLSGGQRKRASLGLELLLAPPVLLLDEPTSGLDPALEESTMRLLRQLADQGRAILTTTHSTASLDLVDLLVVVVQGRLAWVGPPAAALEHFRVVDHDLIFKKLRRATPAEWESRYRNSATRRAMAQRPSP